MYNIEQRDIDLLHTTAAIRYHCHFHRAAQHLLCIDMQVDTSEEVLTLVMPSWTPGSYKIREFVSHQGNLVVRDENETELKYEWTSKNILVVFNPKRSKTVTVSYTYYANERTVRTMHINRWRAFIMPVNCMMYVKDRMHEMHHVYVHLADRDWQYVSTALSPVDLGSDSENVHVLGALNYDVLADSPLEIGNHEVRTFEACGAMHEVALVSTMNLDIDWLTAHCQTIVETEAKLFGGVPYDRYVFMVQVGLNVYGGLEHSRCSVNLIDYTALTDKSKSGRLLALLCHEYFHTWNIKRIRPVEYGPFDYVHEVYSPMLWLAEGFTSYYDDLLSYRCGFMDKEEYLKNISEEHFGRLNGVPGRFAMSTRDASYLAWVKLYAQSPDGNNRYPSYYLKGGVLTLLLELHIIAQSKATKRLDDVMRELWREYLERPHQGHTEKEVFDAIENSTGVQCRELFATWLDDCNDVDYNTYLAPFGLHWSMQDAPTDDEDRVPLSSGLSLKEDAGRLLISGVNDGSAAQSAGLAIDDEIIAVNELRVTTTAAFAELLNRENENGLDLLCNCDGRLFNARLVPTVKKIPMLSRDVNPSDEQRGNLEFWLQK